MKMLATIILGVITFFGVAFVIGVIAAIARVLIKIIFYFIGVGIAVIVSVYFFLLGWSIAGMIFTKAFGG